jgi:hypothetical protein
MSASDTCLALKGADCTSGEYSFVVLALESCHNVHSQAYARRILYYLLGFSFGPTPGGVIAVPRAGVGDGVRVLRRDRVLLGVPGE